MSAVIFGTCVSMWSRLPGRQACHHRRATGSCPDAGGGLLEGQGPAGPSRPSLHSPAWPKPPVGCEHPPGPSTAPHGAGAGGQPGSTAQSSRGGEQRGGRRVTCCVSDLDSSRPPCEELSCGHSRGRGRAALPGPLGPPSVTPQSLLGPSPVPPRPLPCGRSLPTPAAFRCCH